MFKQFLQASALQFVQIDSCRLGSVNENLAVLLMAHKFKGKTQDMKIITQESYVEPKKWKNGSKGLSDESKTLCVLLLNVFSDISWSVWSPFTASFQFRGSLALIFVLKSGYNTLTAVFSPVPVCPHAGGVGLCELVQHLILFDYICVSGSLSNRWESDMFSSAVKASRLNTSWTAPLFRRVCFASPECVNMLITSTNTSPAPWWFTTPTTCPPR